METPPPKTYSVRILCFNCNAPDIPLSIPLGLPVREFMQKQSCPNCGCSMCPKYS